MDNHQLAARIRQYSDLLTKESDRGSVIVGAAILEDLLEQVILARRAPALEKDDELVASASAPCGTFSAKIDLAYRIGSLDLDWRSSFHLIRKMRNEAAHAGDRRDLSSPQLQQRLRELLRLNEDVVAGLWDIIKTLVTVPAGIPSKGPSMDLVSTVGWRLTWDVLVAALAAGLSFSPERQERLMACGPSTAKLDQSA